MIASRFLLLVIFGIYLISLTSSFKDFPSCWDFLRTAFPFVIPGIDLQCNQNPDGHQRISPWHILRYRVDWFVGKEFWRFFEEFNHKNSWVELEGDFILIQSKISDIFHFVILSSVSAVLIGFSIAMGKYFYSNWSDLIRALIVFLNSRAEIIP